MSEETKPAADRALMDAAEDEGVEGEFTEKVGLQRQKVWMALGVLGAVIAYGLIQVAQPKRAGAAESEPAAQIAETQEYPSARQPDWAQPVVVQDSVTEEELLAAAPETLGADGGGFRPLGNEVAAAQGVETGGFAPASPTEGAVSGPQGSSTGRAPTPEDVRRAEYAAAASAREFRVGRRPKQEEVGGSPAAGEEAGYGESEPVELDVYSEEDVEAADREAEAAREREAIRRYGTPQVEPARAPQAAVEGAPSLFHLAGYTPQGPGDRVIQAGTVLSVALVTPIQWEQKGAIVQARTTRPILDGELRQVLVAPGARVLCRVEMIDTDAARVLLACLTLQLPGGRSVKLPEGVLGYDLQGGAGLSGTRISRRGERLKGAGITAGATAAIAGAMPAETPEVYGRQPTRRERAVNEAVASMVGSAAEEFERERKREDFVLVAGATQFTLVVPEDVELDPKPAPAARARSAVRTS